MAFRLGRLAHDPAAVAAAPSLGAHRFAVSAPPPSLSRASTHFQPGLYQNDTLPDCTAAGLANAANAVAAVNGYQLVIEPALVPEFYGECIGQPNVTDDVLAATEGAVLLDVLKRQVTGGFNVGPQSLVGLFGTLPARRSVLASSMAELGHIYLGVTLRERDMDGPYIWNVEDGRDDGAVVGGHCIVGWDYAGLGDTSTLRLATWGRWQSATWAWLEARLDEAYALVWRQLAAADGTALGVDVATLETALTAFTTPA